VNFVAGVGVANAVFNCVTKLAKLLNDSTGLVVTEATAPGPTLNRGRNTAGSPAGGAGATCGTMVSGGA